MMYTLERDMQLKHICLVFTKTRQLDYLIYILDMALRKIPFVPMRSIYRAYRAVKTNIVYVEKTIHLLAF